MRGIHTAKRSATALDSWRSSLEAMSISLSETAVEILNTEEVEMVAQLHSLEVILTLKDGTEIRTVEPTIDAIFQEVQKCGQLCSQIVLGTE